MNKTILNELRFFVSDGLDNYDESIKVSEIWDKINELLEKEKQQIEDAYNEGYERRSYIHDREYGGIEYWNTEPKELNEYYTQKFPSNS
jgi:hypothetical protein